jgi:hypothetical protein
MSTRYRFNFYPGSSEAGCGACGHVFLSAASFDRHRDIRPQGRRGDEAQDGGRCSFRALRQDQHGRWGSTDEIERVLRMQRAREAR